MFSINELCFLCLKPKQPSKTICLHCKKEESSFHPHPLYLKPKTLLKSQYLIGKVLGQGGFGITYLGLDIHLNKFVAIKEYLPTILAIREGNQILPLKNQSENFLKGLHSFLEEARHLARFDHPHIVRVLNYFEENKTGYMVMEYIDGESPAFLLKQHGGILSVENTFAILLPILDALETIHAQHIYHLDISAHNILIDKNNTPILIDFGAARSMNLLNEQTHTLTLVLKAGYSPPEQYSGKGHIGAWTDIYACGALFYLLLSGKLPPAATDRWQNNKLPHLKITPHLNQVIKKALQLKIEQRFQNILEFRKALLSKSVEKNIVLLILFLVSGATIGYSQINRKMLIPDSPMLVSQTLATLDTSPISQLIENIDIYDIKNNETEVLFKNAYQQIADLKLSHPPHDNAYQSYLVLKKQLPNDPRIETLIEKIAETYLILAQQQTQPEKKRSFLEKGLEIAPQHAGLKALQLALEKTTQKSSEIETLLIEALHLQTNGQLDEAADKYQKILIYQQNHKVAQHYLKQIAQQFAKRAEQSKVPADALVWITKALHLQPNQPVFLNLQNHIRQQLEQPKEIIKEVVKEKEIIKEVEVPIQPPPSEPIDKPKPPLLVTPSF
jgi:serine/threonine protein kinase